MRKMWIILSVLFLTACSAQQAGEVNRVVLAQQDNSEEIMILEQAEMNWIQEQLQQVSWEPNVQPDMARVEDLQMQLFIEKNPNMPESIITYQIWIENDQSLTMVSNEEKEGYGRLKAEKSKELVAFFYEKIASLKPVIDKHGQIENGEGFEQFVQQVNDKTPANLLITRYTIEGDPIYLRAKYDGTHIQVEIDNREDKFGSGMFENYTCEALDSVHNGENLDYYLTGCNEEGAKIQLLETRFDTENEQFTKELLPEISLTIGEKVLAVQKGTYGWTLPTNNPTEMLTIETDHASPNQMLDIANAVKVDKSASRNIQFEVEPSRVEYRVWNQEKMLGTYQSIEEIDLSEPFILEVFAFWGENYATYVATMQFE